MIGYYSLVLWAGDHHADYTVVDGPAMAPRSGAWPRVRAAHLDQFPTCAACGGAAHLQVHHVEPFHRDPILELDPDNLITLCEAPGHNCHFVFGHLHDWSSWNVDVRDDAARHLAKVKDRP